MESKPQTERKYLQNEYLIKDLYPKLLRTLKTQNKKNNLIKKWAKGLNWHLTKEDKQMVNKHMKKYPSYFMRKMQIQTTRCYSTPISMAKMWHSDNIKCWQGCRTRGTFLLFQVGTQKGAATLEDNLVVSYKTKHYYHTIPQSHS